MENSTRTTRLNNNQVKAEKRLSNGKKRRPGCCSFCGNCTSTGLCLARLKAIRLPTSVKHRRNQRRKVLGSIRRVRFTLSTLRQASIRENKGPSLGKYVKIPSSAKSVRMNLRTGPMKRLKDNSDASEGRHGILSENILHAQKKRTKLHSFRLPISGLCGRIHNKTRGKRVCG